MRALAVSVPRVSGTPSTAACTVATAAVVEPGVTDYSVARAAADLAGAGFELPPGLVPLGGQLQPQGREPLLTRATPIAAADGGVGSAEPGVARSDRRAAAHELGPMSRELSRRIALWSMTRPGASTGVLDRGRRQERPIVDFVRADPACAVSSPPRPGCGCPGLRPPLALSRA
jgi:hypothetical protein